ncbi:MAG: Asp-tRNA(Asn)/Glu-tRNA(Gln) amidotransferase subunit GatC [Acidimicrobiia bacterium]|nr:Asp-tRNA(Asn)/Glu-tRNA(Gln) amidotransferase subunit GatC [Acidimicrobiia bacterium]
MLRLTDEELEVFTSQLGAVLEHAEDVEALDVSDVPPTQHPYPLVNVFRPDVVEVFDNRDAALEMGPAIEDDRFRVPPAHGEEP